MSNGQAIQNLCTSQVQVYIEETECDTRMDEFNSVIARLTLRNVDITEAETKSLIIRSFPKSMSVISTVEKLLLPWLFKKLILLYVKPLNARRNPLLSKSQPSANFPAGKTRLTSRNSGSTTPIRNRGNCHYCGIPGHFKRVCRKKKQTTESAESKMEEIRTVLFSLIRLDENEVFKTTKAVQIIIWTRITRICWKM